MDSVEEDQQQPPRTTIPHAAFLMVWELLRTLQETHPEVIKRYVERMDAMRDSEIGQDNKLSMDLIASMLEDFR